MPPHSPPSRLACIKMHIQMQISIKPITDVLNTDLHWILVMGYRWEKVDKFCYLGDMLDADGGYDSAVTTSQICSEKVS